MGKPYRANLYNFKRKFEERTLGSETSQYQEEKKKIFISKVAASEKEKAQTEHHLRRTIYCPADVLLGVVR
jgi:hypothetical protein